MAQAITLNPGFILSYFRPLESTKVLSYCTKVRRYFRTFVQNNRTIIVESARDAEQARVEQGVHDDP